MKSTNKIYRLSELVPIIQKLKENGKKICLANGCFDLIHIGHIRYLKEAKAAGDVLMVAINSDRSLRHLKGKHRPLINETGRAKIVASFYFVDYVVIFSEKNVNRILLTLKPDFHCKGSDYTVETVPERDTVLAYGGKIAIVGGEKIRSTSEIIDQIKKNYL